MLPHITNKQTGVKIFKGTNKNLQMVKDLHIWGLS